MSEGLPNYPYPQQGIPVFHPDLNMPPSKAAKMLTSLARSRKGAGGKRGKSAAKPTGFMPQRLSGGAKVFGGGKK